LQRRARRGRQRRTAQVRVHDDPGRVEDRSQGAGGAAAEGGADLLEHGLGADLAAPGALLRAADDAAHHVLAEHLGGGGHVGMRQEMVGARDPTARVGAHRRAPLVVPTSAVLGTGTSSGADGRGPSRPGGSGAAGTVLAGKIPAEADGNRTRQTEMLGLTGFEDRGAHQDTYASAAQTITAGPARIWICWAAPPDGADTLVRRRPAAAPEGGAVIGSGH